MEGGERNQCRSFEWINGMSVWTRIRIRFRAKVRVRIRDGVRARVRVG